MKSSGFIRNLLIGYLLIGGLLGSILYGSYIWPYTWDSSKYMPQANFIERSLALVIVQPFAVFSSLVRTVAWGPSVVIWTLDPIGYSFGQWLVPGLYEEYGRSLK
jgi:hypothetical protein